MVSYRDYASSSKNSGGSLARANNVPAGNGSSARERHRARRAQIDAERAERRRQELIIAEARRQRAFESGRGSKIMATWKLRGGAKTKAWGEVRGGLFYTGSNPSSLIEPSVPEPSLLSPRYPVADCSDDMEPIRTYPTYADMTEKQRKAYVEFLAGNRESARDIGLVFLYLCGLERRLIIDARKPGEVSNDERAVIVRELLRLFAVFGPESASLRHYIGMLLLFDGSVFDLIGVDRAVSLFAPDVVVDNPVRLYEDTDNEDALAYLLAARLVQHDVRVPLRLLVEIAVNSALRSPAATTRGLHKNDLRDDALVALVSERVEHIDFARCGSAARNIDDIERPLYFPASIGIRKNRKTRIDDDIVTYVEDALHVSDVSRVALSCYNELVDARKAIASRNVHGIVSCSLDVLRAVCPPRCALDTHLAGKRESAAVPARVIVDDIRRRFGLELECTSRGVLSTQAQELVAVAAAINGWQVVFPGVVSCAPMQFVRALCNGDGERIIVMFRRGVAHSVSSGRRCIGRVFGSDEFDCSLNIPGDWNVSLCLAYIYAWFIKQSESLGISDTQRFSARYFPAFTSRDRITLRKNQIRLFFSVMSAVVFSDLTARGIKSCLDVVDFTDVKDLLFSLCDDKFGNMIPADALEALEYLYSKAGEDKAMVLYDYHAGTYNVVHDNEVDGFRIDADKLAETINATSDVHVILDEAFSDDDEDYADDCCSGSIAADVVPSGGAVYDNERDAVSKSNSSSTALNDNDIAAEIVKNAFGDADEMLTDDLIAKIIEMSDAVTGAQALDLIAKANEAVPDIVEIDGADAYLN